MTGIQCDSVTVLETECIDIDGIESVSISDGHSIGSSASSGHSIVGRHVDSAFGGGSAM